MSNNIYKTVDKCPIYEINIAQFDSYLNVYPSWSIYMYMDLILGVFGILGDFGMFRNPAIYFGD